MTKKSSRTVSRVILGVVIILLLALAIGLILRFTNLGAQAKDLFNPQFRVECNGVVYTADSENALNLAEYKDKLRFDVKGTNTYTVNVVPNVTEDTDFDYTVGDTVYSFADENLSGYIVAGADVYSECFYVNCGQSYSLGAVLGRIWGGADIFFNAHMQYPYKLMVIADDGEEICILLAYDFPLDVTVSPDSILF